MREKVAVIVPSLNPDEKLMQVVTGVVNAGYKNVILVNDGSDADHIAPFEEAAKFEAVTVLTHEVNKGKGRGLKTAFKHVLDNLPDVVGVVTIDGDNQHQLKDIDACCEKMLELGDHVVLGCRDFSGPDVPARSKFGNNTTARVFKYLCGLKISDTQTGLRAIPRKYLEDFYELKGERFEYETNMLLEFKEMDIPFTEVQIETVYIDENETSHFNPLKDSIKIYGMIFKFMLSSIGSCVLDLAAFQIFKMIFRNAFGVFEGLVMAATVCARIISSMFNFTLNKKAVFKSKEPLKDTVIRYYILCICQMLVSGGLLTGVTMLLGVSNDALTLILKLLVDTCLFLISFGIQRKWVFRR